MTHDYQPHNYQLSAELEATCPEPITPREEPQYHICGIDLTNEALCEEAAKRLASSVREIVKGINKLCLAIYIAYGKQNYPRVAHLATHSKKARIRKKNKSRLKRFMQTELKER